MPDLCDPRCSLGVGSTVDVLSYPLKREMAASNAVRTWEREDET